jgi:glycosyltransferase involved in cell wall biosynthesis
VYAADPEPPSRLTTGQRYGSVAGDPAVKVLHICPLWFRISPNALGGIETLLAGLLKEFARAGCDNTVLAVDGSTVAGQLVPIVDRPLYELTSDGRAWEYGPFEQAQLLAAIEMAAEHDVIHSHLSWGGWVLSGIKGVAERVLHTLHNAVTPDMEWFVAGHPAMRLSAVSEYQAKKLRRAGATRCEVVYNGLDFARFPLQTDGKQGLVYLGRIDHAKGTDIAISVAEALQMELTLAGPPINHHFFDAEIRPRLNDRVRYVGTVDHEEKVRLLGGASCVLMPSRWEEGFALVALEAMACGTPVVALANGGLPEAVENEVTGFVSSDERELSGLVARATALDSAHIRRRAERFSVAASAAGYLELYRAMVSARGPRI